MTSTITPIKEGRANLGSLNGKLVTLDITSYPTNGESITPGLLGVHAIDALFVISSESEDVIYRWDKANEKLKAIVASTGAEVANTTDIGTCEVLALWFAGG